MKRLLVTGASGFLGWNICQILKTDWEVVGVYFTYPIAIPGAVTLQTDLADYRHLKKLFEQVRPDAVIHCAAISNPNFCQLNRQQSHQVNVEASINIAGLCSDRSIACLFTSSDLVFDGLHAPYRERDPVCPVNVYGEHKVLAEQGMIKRYPQVIVCRMPLMFGDAGPAASSFVQPMIRAMQEGRELRLFVDEFRTPISGKVAVQGISIALERAQGVIHLGGMERVSRYDFGRLLAEVAHFHDARLKPCRQQDIEMAAPRSADVSLENAKAVALGFKPLPLKEDLEAWFSVHQERLETWASCRMENQLWDMPPSSTASQEAFTKRSRKS